MPRLSAVKLYYDVRWFLWDMRDWLFVKWAMQKLKRDDVVYIHPNPQAGPKALLIRAEQFTSPDGENFSHSHVEGY